MGDKNQDSYVNRFFCFFYSSLKLVVVAVVEEVVLFFENVF